METGLRKTRNSVPEIEPPTLLSVERAAVLLKKLSEHGEPLGVRDLARENGYSASTTQKVLNALSAHGLVQQDPETQRYALGLELFRIGVSVLHQMDIHQIARPALEQLVHDTQESAYLALLTQDQLRCVYIDKLDCGHLLRWTADPGVWRPLNCTADGKAILACLPASHLRYLNEHEAFHRLTERSHLDVASLQQDLAQIPARGYAYSDEEFAEGVRSLAVPIFDYTNTIKGSVSISGPKSRMDDGRIAVLGQAVHRAGRAISKAWGSNLLNGFYGQNASSGDNVGRGSTTS